MGEGAVNSGRSKEWTHGKIGVAAEVSLLRALNVIPRSLAFSLVFEDRGMDV